MIITGGKYCAVAGAGAAKAANVRAAARPMAFGFMDAFLVCDLLAAMRDLPERQPAERIPSRAALPTRLFASPVAHRLATPAGSHRRRFSPIA
jgi:hypothetical protein